MTAITKPTSEQLRTIDLLDDLDDDQLGRWVDACSMQSASAGTRIREVGAVGVGVIFLLEGKLEMLVPDGEVEAHQGYQSAPTWIGAVPAVLGAPGPIGLRADSDVRFATIEPETFVELSIAHRSVFTRVMAQLKPMMIRVAQRQQQQDRLEALGTMAAGLAHELNNPASAARRAAAELAESLGVLAETIGVFVESGVEREEASRLVALQTSALERCAARSVLSSLETADREDELGQALADLDVPEPWTLGATFAAAGLDTQYIQDIAATAGPLTTPVIRWVGASLAARQLVAELSESTTRMSDLVSAIKRYAYARPGHAEDVDLREGLETTLTLLKHKIKHTSIKVARDYDESLGPVSVFTAELNQVWTNLLDNAIDALGEEGTITITTRADDDCAEVDIADDGPGIPTDIQRRVFDPFFTTKDVGRGTGLGLDAARRIIVDMHHGSLTVQSKPGHTIFRARFPMNAARR